MKTGFRQQTSFIARLRMILLIIAAFFVLGIMSLYLSSQGFLVGVQDMANINRVQNLTGTTLQAIRSSEESLQKIKAGVTSSRVIPLKEASRIAHENIKLTIGLTDQYPKVQEKFRRALESIKQFNESFEGLLSGKEATEKLSEEILVSREFLVDAEEDLREAQILLKNQSDKTFSDIYENRFNPLIVAGLLSSMFFGFVVVVGFANSRKLGASLENLNRATDAVATGDLSYQAKILEADEFGKLTFEFNQMVHSIRDKQTKLTEAVEKVTKLQSITNTFSSVLLPEDVFEVIVMDVHKALRADAGAISLINEERTGVENRIIGYQTTVGNVSMNYKSPLMNCIRSREPIFVTDVRVLKDEYPIVYEILQRSKVESSAYIPLIVGNQIYGALNFGFFVQRVFTDEEKDFMIALTRQCAQAIHRAKLFKSANDAIQLRDEFLSIASHELRTPLTPLKLQLQNMSRQVKKGQIQITQQDAVLKIVENSDKQVDRLINLIDDLLDVSRISAGKLTLHLESFNFGEMAEEVIAHYSTQMREAHSLLTVDIDKDIVCNADRVRMEQVLINLLTNAVKYAPKKPVHVRLSRNGDRARLEVRDEGQGITPENQKRIFDRFERVRDKNNIGGLGLGLYICRQIVEAHQGSISVESMPGKGSTFIVEIPALS